MQKWFLSILGPCNNEGVMCFQPPLFQARLKLFLPDPQAFKQYSNTVPWAQLLALLSLISPHTLSEHSHDAQPANIAVDSSISGQKRWKVRDK